MNRQQAVHSGLDAVEEAVSAGIGSFLPVLPEDRQRRIWNGLRNNRAERRVYLQDLADKHGDTRPIDQIDTSYVEEQTNRYG